MGRLFEEFRAPRYSVTWKNSGNTLLVMTIFGTFQKLLISLKLRTRPRRSHPQYGNLIYNGRYWCASTPFPPESSTIDLRFSTDAIEGPSPSNQDQVEYVIQHYREFRDQVLSAAFPGLKDHLDLESAATLSDPKSLDRTLKLDGISAGRIRERPVADTLLTFNLGNAFPYLGLYAYFSRRKIIESIWWD